MDFWCHGCAVDTRLSWNRKNRNQPFVCVQGWILEKCRTSKPMFSLFWPSCHLISMSLSSHPCMPYVYLQVCVSLPLWLSHIAYIRRWMTCYCERFTAERAGIGEEDRLEKHTGGTTNDREGSNNVRISMMWWEAYCTVVHILKDMTNVAQTGAMVTATDWVRDRGSVKNWCALVRAAEQSGG